MKRFSFPTTDFTCRVGFLKRRNPGASLMDVANSFGWPELFSVVGFVTLSNPVGIFS